MYSICIHVCILYAYHHTPPSPGKNCSQMSTGLGSQTKCTEKSCFRQNKPLSSSNCSNPMLLQFAKESPDLCERMHFTFLVKGWKFKQSLSLCLSDIGVWSWLSEHTNSDRYQARVGHNKWDQWWFIAYPQQMRSVVVHCLCHFMAAFLVPCHSLACRNGNVLQLSIMSQKTKQKLWPFFFFFFQSGVLSTSSEPDDNRPPTQEGKQTSQESASTTRHYQYQWKAGF